MGLTRRLLERGDPTLAWAVVEVDPAVLDEKAERVNIALPRRVLARLDAKARAAGETRSGYIARLALSAK